MTRKLLSVQKETPNKLMKECVDEYLSHHPDHHQFKSRIRADFKLRKTINYYLGIEDD